ncbi:MAG: hypothetical protein AB1679_00765 [Actinomycetota bacterium]
MTQLRGVSGCEVTLDERSGEANGAAYLVHMLLTQQAEADQSGRFAREAERLKPVKIFLTDTEEACAVSSVSGGLRITSDLEGRYPTFIRAESRHVIDVTKIRLAGRVLITGPLRDKKFWGLLGDIATRKVVIKGLISHYVNTLRFLWLVNVRSKL